jgi:hypothetical protein
MRFFKLTLYVLLLNTVSVFGQTTDPCRKSTEGTDFWFGFMEGRNYQVGHFNEITVTSSYSCKYDIFIGKSKTAYLSGTVSPNIPVRITIDWTLVEAIGSETIQEKAIHLISDNPLNVYAFNWSPNSSEVALIFPTNSLGSEYYAICYTPHINGNGINTGSGRNSEFLVVASEDNTVVHITPSKVTDQGKPANTTYSIILNKGELYQVQSENLPIPVWPGQGDLTGSYITSDKPVALYSGSLSTTVPGDASVSAWDHLYEQIPPVQTWGRKFVAVPLKSRHEDTYRILAAEDNTIVRVGNKSPFALDKGQYHEFMLLYNEPSLIESDKPILLAQYSNSNSVDFDYTGGDGDPFLVIVSPVNQTREKVAFVAYASQQVKSKFFINVVVKDDAVGKIKLDNADVNFNSLGGTGYSYAQVSIGSGDHYIESIEPGKGFIAYVYGFGGVEAYGYGVGYNLDIVLDLGSNINASGDKLLVQCDGAKPLILSAGNSFDHYLWSTGDTTSSIQINKAGWYKVNVSTNEGCVLNDSVKLQVSKPVIDFGPDTTICNNANIVLDAGAKEQFQSYLWTTPQAPFNHQKYTVTSAGIYSVTAISKYGCKAGDTIKVSFTDKPKINFSRLDTLVCGIKSTLIDITTDKGNFTVQRLVDNQIFSGLNVSVPDFGIYDLKIKATDQFSCYSDSVIKFGFHKIPLVGFNIDTKKCSRYNLLAKYEGDADPAISNFKWAFRGDVIANEIGLNSLIVPLGINRPKRDLVLTVTQNGCSDSVSQNIIVTPLLQLQSTPQVGCEPFTANFSATNTEVVDYFWDFGDGAPIVQGDSITSYYYRNAGFYNVMLKIVTKDGCSNEVKIDSLVHVAPIPTSGFTPFDVECLSKGNNSISYLGSGNQFDTYNWDLSGFDSAEIIQNPGTTQGPFVFSLKNKPQTQVRLSVISKFNCNSDTATVIVKRKPDFSMNTSSSLGCTPFEPTFTGKANDPIDQLSYSWNFGDGKSGVGNQINHSYLDPDRKYDIVLNALSSITGCSDTIFRKNYIGTYPKPIAAFNMDNKIVYNDQPTVNFTNTSSGDKTYSWNFGDGLTSDQKDPSHYYNVTGYRTVVLEAFNEFGCSDTVSHQLLVAFDRIFPPNAFSPNAPNLVDREYKLGSNGIATEGYHLTILSRWDDIVFEAKGEIKGWNGQIPNGSMAPAGTYVWVLDFYDFLGRRHRQTGTVTVIY